MSIVSAIEEDVVLPHAQRRDGVVRARRVLGGLTEASGVHGAMLAAWSGP